MSPARCVRCLSGVVTLFVAMLVCGLPLLSQEGAQPKPIFVLIYIDRDFPNDWIAMSRHPNYADAQLARKDLVKIDGVISTDIIPVDPITGKKVAWPADVKKDDQPKVKAPDLPNELPPRRSIVVRVYKDGVEQPDKKLETATDYDRAKDYYDRMNKMPGWKATWNAPGWPRPDIGLPKTNRVDIGPYNPLVGSWISGDSTYELLASKKAMGTFQAGKLAFDGIWEQHKDKVRITLFLGGATGDKTDFRVLEGTVVDGQFQGDTWREVGGRNLGTSPITLKKK